jgi:HK97 family phage prohead protease
MTKPLDRDRAYSMITVKAVDESDGKRTIKGTATTPDVDRVSDIVYPLGVQFKNPMPLLHQHDHDRPIGTVSFQKPTAKGIEFTAELPIIDEPGPLKDRVDTAWGEVKHGLVRAVSIGFRPLKYAYNEKTGGYDFLETEVYELSLVTIPANASALISSVGKAIPQTIKSFDTNAPAASGTPERKADDSPRVLGKSRSVNLVQPVKGSPMAKSIAEQIAAYEAAKVAKTARVEEITSKSVEAGRSTDTEEKAEIDELLTDIEALDADIKNLTRLQAAKASSAQPIATVPGPTGGHIVGTEHAGTPARAAVQIKNAAPAPGIRLARFARAKFIAKETGQSIMDP